MQKLNSALWWSAHSDEHGLLQSWGKKYKYVLKK